MLGAFFLKKKQKNHPLPAGCLLSHTRIGAKEEAPPTQLAAVDIYTFQIALEYTFRGASGPLRDSRPVCESSCCWDLPGFSRVKPRGERVTRLTPGFLAVPAAVQQSILYLRDETRVVCGLWGWSVSVCAAACVQASSRLSAVCELLAFSRRPDRQTGGYPICTPGAPVRPFV